MQAPQPPNRVNAARAGSWPEGALGTHNKTPKNVLKLPVGAGTRENQGHSSTKFHFKIDARWERVSFDSGG